MKKHLLIGFGAWLLASTAAHAQPDTTVQIPPARLLPDFSTTFDTPSTIQPPATYRFVMPALPTISAVTGLEAVAGKPDTFKLQRGRYDVKELLETLAGKTGGKAVFVEGFKAKTLGLYLPLQGTALELIEKMEEFGFAAGKLGKDWVFVPVKRQISSLPLTYLPATPFKFQPRKFDHFGMPGITPFDPNKVPPGATPFDFNGDRVYHVPLRPNQK